MHARGGTSRAPRLSSKLVLVLSTNCFNERVGVSLGGTKLFLQSKNALTVSCALECDSLSSVKPFSPPNTSRRGSALDLFQKGSKSCSDLLELGSVVAVAAEDGPEPFWLGVLEGERPMFGRQNAWLRREGQLGIGVPLRSFLGKIPAAESFARVRPAHPCCSQRCAAGRTRRTHTRTPLDSNWPRS